MKSNFDHKFRFYASKINEICLHCHWLYFSSFILSFRQCVRWQVTIDNGAADHHHLSNRHCLSMVQIVLGKPIKSDASAAMVLTMLKKNGHVEIELSISFFLLSQKAEALHVIIILGRSDQVRKNMGETSSFFFPSFFWSIRILFFFEGY